MNRVEVQISYENLKHNLDLIKTITNNKTIICMVKDNAYGLGGVNIAKFLSNDSLVKAFAVASFGEAMHLKSNDITKDIIIIGHIFKDDYVEAILNDFILTVSTLDQAIQINNFAKKHNKKARIEIGIDSGMGRIGFNISEETIKDIIKINDLDNISIYGFFSHFPVADCNKDDTYNIKWTDNQEKQFDDFIDKINSYGINYNDISFSNSAGILTKRGTKYSSVRPGIILYGLLPNHCFLNYDFRPIMQFKSRIIHIKEINENTSISYGRTFISKNKMKVATVACGYGDGYPRSASNKTYVIINDKRCPVIGKVTMDMFMVDVTKVDCKVEDEVILIGESKNEQITIDEICKLTGEFNYELLTRINARVKRVYKD